MIFGQVVVFLLVLHYFVPVAFANHWCYCYRVTGYGNVMIGQNGFNLLQRIRYRYNLRLPGVTQQKRLLIALQTMTAMRIKQATSLKKMLNPRRVGDVQWSTCHLAEIH